MKEDKNLLGKWEICRKGSMAVFAIATLWLLGMSAKLIVMLYSRGLFTDAEWAKYHRYPGYAKYVFAVQMAALIVFAVTSRKNRKK